MLHDEVCAHLLVPPAHGPPAEEAGVAGRPLLQDVRLHVAVQAADHRGVLRHVVQGVVAQVEQVALHGVADQAGVRARTGGGGTGGGGTGGGPGGGGPGRHRGQVGGELAAQLHRLQVGHRTRLGATARR